MHRTRDNFFSCLQFVVLLLVCFPLRSKGFEDTYIADAQTSCFKSNDAYSCLKLRALKYVSNLASSDSWPLNEGFANDTLTSAGRMVRLVKIKNYQDEDQPIDKSGMFDESRQMEGDTEWDKFIKFGKRQIFHMLKTNGITLTLPEGARTIHEDEIKSSVDARSSPVEREARGKKKKLAVLLPLLSLLALFKIKLVLIPILLIVLFIKKILVLGTLFLPSVLSTLKICKAPHMPHHGQWAGAEVSADYGASYGGYGGGGGGYASANGAYSKDWAASRAYNGYKQPNGYKTLNEAQFAAPNPNLAYSASAGQV